MKSLIFRELKSKTMRSIFYKQGLTFILAASFIILSGCASIVSKTKYPVSIHSTPTGAKVTVTDKKGKEVFIGNTPAICTLKAGAGFFTKASYMVKFEIEGYNTKSATIDFNLDGWYFGNIIFGGLIGLLIIDPATGAMWKLSSEFVNETLTKSSITQEEPVLKFYSIHEIPESWKDNLIRIN